MRSERATSSVAAAAAVHLMVALLFGIGLAGNRAMAAGTEDLESAIAALKARTAQAVEAARTKLEALPPEQRLASPPAVWRVPDALAEFRDCGGCPPMVVVPAGEFTMGASPLDPGGPTQHRVTIAAPFAVSKFEVTFEEWDACVADGGCGGYSPSDEGWGRGKQPVMNISWLDAKAYTAWLSAKTGKTYRLLSEAEWEYATRAGTATRFSVGDAISPKEANFDGSDGADVPGPSDMNRQQALPVGSFSPNAFGLYDMHGNVAEWVEDCWFDDYTAQTPTDGSPSREGNCKGHAVRGGSWEDSDTELRSAARTGGAQDDRFYTDGLRIARNL
jgi:formylglycine-generating enzyme required for sulfatase activity